MSEKGYSIPQSKSWYQSLSDDLASEVEAYTGEKRSTIEEMRRLLAVKGCYQLFDRMQAARQGKRREEALKSVARVMPSLCIARVGSTRGAKDGDCEERCEQRAHHLVPQYIGTRWVRQSNGPSEPVPLIF